MRIHCKFNIVFAVGSRCSVMTSYLKSIIFAKIDEKYVKIEFISWEVTEKKCYELPTIGMGCREVKNVITSSCYMRYQHRWNLNVSTFAHFCTFFTLHFANLYLPTCKIRFFHRYCLIVIPTEFCTHSLTFTLQMSRFGQCRKLSQRDDVITKSLIMANISAESR